MEMKRIKKKTSFLILILLLIGLAIVFRFDNRKVVVDSTYSTTIDVIKTKTNSKINSNNSNNQKKQKEYVSPINKLRQKYKNNDIKAELKIDYLGIDVVITQSSNNSYYLNHDAYKKENELGSVYLDYRTGNNLDKERQLNIYSHNSNIEKYQKKLPFSQLKKLLTKNNFENVNNIYLYTSDRVIEYEVYAIKIVEKDKEHMILDASNDDLWQSHLDKLLTNTKLCKGKCKLSKNDNLLILQTCNYNPVNSYIVLITRKVK